MCRWLADSASSVLLEELFPVPAHYGVVRAGRDELAPFAPQPWVARAQAVASAS